MNPKAAKESLKLKTVRLSRRTKKELGVKVSDERTAQRLEEQIPRLVKNATTQAYARALAAGNSVLVADAGHVVEVFPNGERRIVKKLEPSVKMQKGRIIKIK